MSPKMKTRDVKMRSCRKNKTKETAPIKSPPKKTKPKRRIIEKMPNVKSAPSASTASCAPTEGNKNAEMRSCRKNKTKETASINSPLKMTKPKRRIMQKTSKDKNVKSVPSPSTASCIPTEENKNAEMRSCRKNKTKETAPINSPPKMTKPKRRIMQKTSKDKKNVKSVPSASTASCVPTEENKNAEKEREKSEIEELRNAEKERKKAERERKREERMTSQMMKYSLNAYKHSVDYQNLKKKKFNTGFINETPRRYEIEIYTPEEDNDPKWKENLPAVRNTITGEPGEKYANIFMNMPIDSDEEPEEIVKTKGKRGRKKAVGYKGVPLPDECLVTNYETLLYSPGCSK